MALRRDPPPVTTLERFSSSYSVPLADGTFTLRAGAGDYRLTFSPVLGNSSGPPPPAAWRDAYVKSIRLGNVDVLNGNLHLDRQPDVPLEIVVGTNPGSLEVRVVDDRQQPAPDMSVILVPNARGRTDLYRTGTTDSSGRLRLDRLPPGDYKVFASPASDTTIWYDPDFIRNYENVGRTVRIVEGGTAEVQVAPVP